MYHFSPLSFMNDPLLWLRTISKYGAHWTSTPGFALPLCVRRYVSKSAVLGIKFFFKIKKTDPKRKTGILTLPFLIGGQGKDDKVRVSP